MNDNEAPPRWVEEILDRHDLWLRSDSPRAAASVLLADGAADLTALSETVFAEQAITSASRDSIETLIRQLQDVVRLSALCPSEPAPGVVHVSPDGTRCWEPRPA